MHQLLKDFRQHPESVGETYVEHWWTAMGFALMLFVSSLACLLHAFIPGLCKGTASRSIQALHERMVTHRTRRPASQSAASVR